MDISLHERKHPLSKMDILLFDMNNFAPKLISIKDIECMLSRDRLREIISQES